MSLKESKKNTHLFAKFLWYFGIGIFSQIFLPISAILSTWFKYIMSGDIKSLSPLERFMSHGVFVLFLELNYGELNFRDAYKKVNSFSNQTHEELIKIRLVAHRQMFFLFLMLSFALMLFESRIQVGLDIPLRILAFYLVININGYFIYQGIKTYWIKNLYIKKVKILQIILV